MGSLNRDDLEVKTWLVIFRPTEKRTFWHWLFRTKPPFEHVALCGYDPVQDAWLLIDPRGRHTGVAIVTGPMVDNIVLNHIASGCKILSFKINTLIESKPGSALLGAWCVPVAKRLLRVQCVALRPEGLYRWLLRNGAAEFPRERPSG